MSDTLGPYPLDGIITGDARYYVECFSRAGDIILDPFVGGGTTAYVCAQLKRRCLAFEIDADVATRARARMENIQPMLFAGGMQQFALEEAGK